jgi:hypothetical protein
MGGREMEIQILKGVNRIELENLKIAARSLEHLRINYFPWGAGNQSKPNENTDGDIRLRTWAIRDPASPFFRYNGWQTADPDVERNPEVRNVKACARQREAVFLAKGGNCQEHGDTTFDYVRSLPFTRNYQYIHRLTGDGGHHEYTVIGDRPHQNKEIMKRYIVVDPWVTSPQVCLFEHSCWYNSYRKSRDHRFTIHKNQANLQAILSIDDSTRYSVRQARERQRFLWDSMAAAQQDYQKEVPLTWMCINCGTHVSNTQISADTAKCHNCKREIRSLDEKRALITLFKTDPDVYIRNPRRFVFHFRRQNSGHPPKVMPLLEDPSNPFDIETEEVLTPQMFQGRQIMRRDRRFISRTPKVFKKKQGFFSRQSRIKTMQLDVPKTEEMSIKWGEEWWTHPYCTKNGNCYNYYNTRARPRETEKEAAKVLYETLPL